MNSCTPTGTGKLLLVLFLTGNVAAGCKSTESKAPHEGDPCSENEPCKGDLVCHDGKCSLTAAGTGGRSGDGDGDGGDGDGGDGDGDGGDGDGDGGDGDGDTGGDGGDGGDGGAGSTGGDGASGGNGGDSASGGNGGSLGEGELLYDEGDIYVLNNSLGIQGAFFPFQDGYVDGEKLTDPNYIYTELYPTEFESDSQTCVEGRVGVVTTSSRQLCDPESEQDPCRWDVVYGGGIGVTLNDHDVWNAQQAGVQGFSFKTSGYLESREFMFVAKMEGSDDNFCKKFQVVDENSFAEESVDFSELVHNCEGHAPSTMSLDTTRLTELRWQLLPEITSGQKNVASFCVTRLEAYQAK